MMEEHPVILLDLPSQGSNAQLSEALRFEDFAKLLLKFTDAMGFRKITPIGLSYGSATAFFFASLYPNRVDKLILGGTTPRVRDSYRSLLEDTFTLLDQGLMDIFSQGAVMNLINYSKRQTTKIPERVIKGFYKNMMGLSENDKMRYKINTRRLLNLDGVKGTPTCPTLVLTGEFDNFTTPYENFLMSQKVPNSTFILIRESDHLANLEKRDVVINSYLHFLKGHSLEDIYGIDVMTEEKMNDRERRLDPRLKPVNPHAKLIDVKLREIACEIADINYNGCQIRVKDHIDVWEILDFSHYINLELEDAAGLELTAHVLRKTPNDERTLNCIFRRGDFEQGLRLEKYIEALEA